MDYRQMTKSYETMKGFIRSRSPETKINDHETTFKIHFSRSTIMMIKKEDREVDHDLACRLIYKDHARATRVRAEWILNPAPAPGREIMSIAPSPNPHSLLYSSVPFKDASGRWSPRYRGLCACGYVTAEYAGRQRIFREHREHVVKTISSGPPAPRSRKTFRDY
jgi:hypothetical protein